MQEFLEMRQGGAGLGRGFFRGEDGVLESAVRQADAALKAFAKRARAFQDHRESKCPGKDTCGPIGRDVVASAIT